MNGADVSEIVVTHEMDADVGVVAGKVSDRYPTRGIGEFVGIAQHKDRTDKGSLVMSSRVGDDFDL